MATSRPPILFFDGVCNLCNGAVQTILLHDRNEELRLASLQSDLAGELLPAHGVDPSRLNSLVLLENNRAFTESEAVLRTAGLMGGPWSALRYLSVVPAFVRDPIYRWVARNRYRFFGKQEACMLPRPEWKHRFLA